MIEKPALALSSEGRKRVFAFSSKGSQVLALSFEGRK